MSQYYRAEALKDKSTHVSLKQKCTYGPVLQILSATFAAVSVLVFFVFLILHIFITHVAFFHIIMWLALFYIICLITCTSLHLAKRPRSSLRFKILFISAICVGSLSFLISWILTYINIASSFFTPALKAILPWSVCFLPLYLASFLFFIAFFSYSIRKIVSMYRSYFDFSWILIATVPQVMIEVGALGLGGFLFLLGLHYDVNPRFHIAICFIPVYLAEVAIAVLAAVYLPMRRSHYKHLYVMNYDEEYRVSDRTFVVVCCTTIILLVSLITSHVLFTIGFKDYADKGVAAHVLQACSAIITIIPIFIISAFVVYHSLPKTWKPSK